MAAFAKRIESKHQGTAAIRASIREYCSSAQEVEAATSGGVRVNRYLIDTNVISEIHKPRPHGAVVEWFVALREEQVCVSAVTLGELQEGIERTRRQDAAKAQAIERWVDEIERSSVVLPMDGACFRETARLISGKQQELLNDIMIAATARIHGLTVATRNEKDFKHLGVDIINPFKSD
jgi:toxin FitB